LGDRESGDKIESEKSRDFRACEAQVADYCQTQDWVAGAGGIEPPNGGIKISLIIQQFQGAFGKNGENTLQQSQ
jgi:hypothetical protein